MRFSTARSFRSLPVAFCSALAVAALLTAACASDDAVTAGDTSQDASASGDSGAGASSSEGDGEATAGSGSGQAALAGWPLTYDGPTVAGGQLDPGDYAGQDLVLWFWAPW